MEKKLSEILKKWRIERPNEWAMDDFIRIAEKYETLLTTETEPAKLQCSNGLWALLEKWKKRVERLEKNYQFGRDGNDDGGMAHGRRDAIDECIDDLKEEIGI